MLKILHLQKNLFLLFIIFFVSGAAENLLAEDLFTPIEAPKEAPKANKAPPVDPQKAYPEALKLMEAGKMKEAKGLLETLLEQDAKSAQAHNTLADLYLREGNLDLAFQHATEATELDPKLAEAYATLVGVHQRRNEWMPGLSAAHKAIALDPNSAQAHFYFGKLLLDQGVLDQAVQEFQKTLKLEPNFPDVRSYLAKTYSASGSTKAEIEEYLDQLTTAKENEKGSLYRKLGVAYVQVKEKQKAKEALLKALTFDPKDGESYFELAKIYQGEKLKKKAFEAFKNAQTAGYKSLELARILGPMAIEFDEWEVSLTAYQKLLKAEPEEITHLKNLVFLYQQLDRPKDAIQAYQKLTEVEPEVSLHFYNLGVLFQSQEKWNESREALTRAIELDPEASDAHYALSIVACEQGDYTEAYRAYESCLHLGHSQMEALKQFLDGRCSAVPASEIPY